MSARRRKPAPEAPRPITTFDLDVVSPAFGDGHLSRTIGRMVGEMRAVVWCRAHNALVRWESDGSVSVKVNGRRRRRPTLVEAVAALERALGRESLATYAADRQAEDRIRARLRDGCEDVPLSPDGEAMLGDVVSLLADATGGGR